MLNKYYLYKYNKNYDNERNPNIFYEICKVCKDKIMKQK